LKYVGLGKDEDFDGLNLTGQIALIRRGEITFKEKVNNALAANAAGVLIFNNEAGLISGALTQDGSSVGIPVAMIEKAVGEAIVASLNSGVPAKASLVVERTDYASFNGTSMASPHVAGVAALVKAANKKLTAPQLRQILKDSATPMQADPGRPNEFGAGLVNAESAVRKALSL
jgi:subtilisin family serine protease